jgi:hypothetical protein
MGRETRPPPSQDRTGLKIVILVTKACDSFSHEQRYVNGLPTSNDARHGFSGYFFYEREAGPETLSCAHHAALRDQQSRAPRHFPLVEVAITAQKGRIPTQCRRQVLLCRGTGTHLLQQ